jgi:predicted DNA-binding transcriptional regulator YafY
MNNRYLNRIQKIDYLIRIKATGSPRQFARKLSISPSTLFKYLGDMKSLGAPITFCHHRSTYLYEREGTFDFKFQEKTIEA